MTSGRLSISSYWTSSVLFACALVAHEAFAKDKSLP